MPTCNAYWSLRGVSLGFRPRRSLMFCSWGAEEYGGIGSGEYVEVCQWDDSSFCIFLFRNMLKYWALESFLTWTWTLLLRVILILPKSKWWFFFVYCIQIGYHQVDVAASPLLFDAIVEASKMVTHFHHVFRVFCVTHITGSKCVWSCWTNSLR